MTELDLDKELAEIYARIREVARKAIDAGVITQEGLGDMDRKIAAKSRDGLMKDGLRIMREIRNLRKGD